MDIDQHVVPNISLEGSMFSFCLFSLFHAHVSCHFSFVHPFLRPVHLGFVSFMTNLTMTTA